MHLQGLTPEAWAGQAGGLLHVSMHAEGQKSTRTEGPQFKGSRQQFGVPTNGLQLPTTCSRNTQMPQHAGTERPHTLLAELPNSVDGRMWAINAWSACCRGIVTTQCKASQCLPIGHCLWTAWSSTSVPAGKFFRRVPSLPDGFWAAVASTAKDE